MRPKTLSILVGLALTVSGFGAAWASPNLKQRAETRERRVMMQLQQLTADLGLSEDQKERVRPIIEAKMDETRALRMNDELSSEEKEAQLHTVQASYRQQIRALLTDGQQKRLDELKETRSRASREDLGRKQKRRIPVAPDEE